MKIELSLMTALFLALAPLEARADAAAKPDVLAAVQNLVGKWQGDATLTLGGKTHAFTYTMVYRPTADATGITMEESADVPGVGSLRGMNLIGFDAHGGKLNWFSVDNFGTTHNHLGELVGKGHLRLVHESTRDGKPFHEQFDIQMLGPDRYKAKLVATLGGQLQEVIEGTFVRKGT